MNSAYSPGGIPLTQQNDGAQRSQNSFNLPPYSGGANAGFLPDGFTGTTHPQASGDPATHTYSRYPATLHQGPLAGTSPVEATNFTAPLPHQSTTATITNNNSYPSRPSPLSLDGTTWHCWKCSFTFPTHWQLTRHLDKKHSLGQDVLGFDPEKGKSHWDGWSKFVTKEELQQLQQQQQQQLQMQRSNNPPGSDGYGRHGGYGSVDMMVPPPHGTPPVGTGAQQRMVQGEMGFVRNMEHQHQQQQQHQHATGIHPPGKMGHMP